MVISTVNQVVYNGDGVTTAWPYTFRIIDATDINLTIIDADGTETDVSADYYVDTVNNTVYYPGYAPGAEPPAEDQPPKVQTGQKLVVYRELPITQEKDLGEKWPFEVIELGLDKLTMILQQIYGWWGRAFKISEGAIASHPGFDTNVPIEAGKSFRVNDAGTGFVVAEDPSSAVEEARAAADAAIAAMEETVAIANNPIYLYFNPQSNSYVDPDYVGVNEATGECNIIKIGNKVIMIDTGGFNRVNSTKSYLQNLGVTKVDYLFISHYHGDHAGGLKFMDYLDWSSTIVYMPPLPIYEQTSPSVSTYYNEVLTFLAAHSPNGQIIYPAEGETVTIDGVVFTMYNCDAAAYADIHDRQTAMIAAWPDYEYYYNDFSMVVTVQHHNVTMVYSGDLMLVSEERMRENAFYQNIQLYKMHHHSQNHYGSAEYAASLNPDIVTVQHGDSDTTAMLGERLISTDLIYFDNKTILIPFKYVLSIKSNGDVLEVLDGKEMYVDRYKDYISLAPNYNRLLPGQDLNDLRQGTYTVAGNAVMNSLGHAPAGWTYGNARLICFYNAESGYEQTGLYGYSIQFMISSNVNGHILMRTYRDIDLGWTDWTELLSGVGGTTKGTMVFDDVVPAIANSVDNGYTEVRGGSDATSAYIAIYGKNHSANPGVVNIRAHNGVDSYYLKLQPTGEITWGGQTIPTLGVSDARRGILNGSVSSISVPANGTKTGSVTFEKAFGGTPNVVVTQTGGNNYVDACVDSISSTGFTWKLVSTNSSAVNTSISWIAIY